MNTNLSQENLKVLAEFDKKFPEDYDRKNDAVCCRKFLEIALQQKDQKMIGILENLGKELEKEIKKIDIREACDIKSVYFAYNAAILLAQNKIDQKKKELTTPQK